MGNSPGGPGEEKRGLKVVFVHSPIYPIGVQMFNELGKHCQLSVIVLGDRFRDHPEWSTRELCRAGRFSLLGIGRGFYRWYLGFHPKLFRHLLKERPDVVVSVAFRPYSFLALLYRFVLRYKFMICADTTAHSDRWAGRLRTWSRSLLTRFSDAVLAYSESAGEYFRSLYSRCRCFLCHYSLSKEKWEEGLAELPPPAALRQRFGIPESATVLLGVGRHLPGKYWELGLDCLRARPDLRYILLGEGSGTEAYRRKALEWGIADRLFLCGNVSQKDLLRYYRIADLLFFPTLSDTFGFVVLEALMSGLPVLCSVYAGAVDLIRDGENGTRFDPLHFDPRQLDAYLESLPDWKRGAERSRREIPGIERQAVRMTEIFEAVLEGRPPVE